MVEADLRPIVLAKAPKYREVAYAAIKKAILSGRLEPNYPLFEEQLAAKLNISRTPVREALALLEHEGLINSSSGNRGLYVHQVTQEEFLDIFTAHEVIEPFLARKAAELATQAQIESLEQNVCEYEHYAKEQDFANFLEVGREFHHLVGNAAGNLSLAESVIRNEERADLYLMSRGKTSDLSSMLASVDEHRAVLNAIKSHNPEEAARLISQHAGSVRSRFIELFQDQKIEGTADARPER